MIVFPLRKLPLGYSRTFHREEPRIPDWGLLQQILPPFETLNVVTRRNNPHTIEITLLLRSVPYHGRIEWIVSGFHGEASSHAEKMSLPVGEYIEEGKGAVAYVSCTRFDDRDRNFPAIIDLLFERD